MCQLYMYINYIFRTDILLWVIDGNTNQVVPPLVLDSYFTLGDRQASDIIGITVSSLLPMLHYLFEFNLTNQKTQFKITNCRISNL